MADGAAKKKVAVNEKEGAKEKNITTTHEAAGA
jgi:hypothetical protein